MRFRDTLSKELLELCSQVTAKRARTVIDHILEYGQITTEELKEAYGYDHPPRAARDVREQGIPLITVKVRSKATGRNIGAYTFGDLTKIVGGRIGGRKAFSKAFKEQLIERYGCKCTITGEKWESRYLQIDHRIPYEISGDGKGQADVEDFMLLDASTQRAKSWSCEHCPNFAPTQRVVDVCRSCFWASPEQYTHVATDEKRRAEIVWTNSEVDQFDQLKERASVYGMSIGDFVKSLLRDRFDEQ